MAERRAREVYNGRERIVGLSLGRTVHEYANQVGLTSDEKLSDAAKDFLPEWVTMNRNVIQRLQRDEIALGNGLNELQLIAIARACQVPETWLGVDPYESGELSRLKGLLIWAPEGGSGPGERQPRSKRTREQVERKRRWSHEPAAQAA